MNHVYIPEYGSRRAKPDEVNFIEAKRVMNSVEKYFGLTTNDLIKKCRRKEIVYPRQVAMYLLGHYTVLTLKSIGVIFGKDHTTVIHSMEVIDGYIFCDPEVKKQLSEIVETF